MKRQQHIKILDLYNTCNMKFRKIIKIIQLTKSGKKVATIIHKIYQACVNIKFVPHVHDLHHKQVNFFLRFPNA